MNVDSVPDARIGSSLRAGAELQSTAPRPTAFHAVPPAPVMPESGRRRERRFGLIPMVSGSQHPIIVREKPKEKLDKRTVARELRAARARQQTAESAYTTAVTTGDSGASAKLKDAQLACDAVAILQRKMLECEAGKPISVHTSAAHDPSEVPDALGNEEYPPSYVCTHEGCNGRSWDTEANMRADHPSDAEMTRRQTTHVWGLRSDAPVDPLDPDGEIVGYIAPIAKNGTRIETVAQEMHDESSANERIEALEALVKQLLAGQAHPAEAPKVPKK
jgi:hypothetical protein